MKEVAKFSRSTISRGEGRPMTIPMQDIRAALARLAECFPRAFVRENQLRPRPLKAGIASDILARCPEFDQRVLSAALGYFTRRVMYLQGMVTGAARVDYPDGISVLAAEEVGNQGFKVGRFDVRLSPRPAKLPEIVEHQVDVMIAAGHNRGGCTHYKSPFWAPAN
jgi:hypothetical protein